MKLFKQKNKNHINVNKHKALKSIVLLILIGTVYGQSFAQYKIRKHSINSGGGQLTGGQYELNASVGQVDVSAIQNGANYKLTGGYWHENNNLIYKNEFE